MTITIEPKLAAQLREKAQIQGLSVEAYIERLVREDDLWSEQFVEPLEENDPEFTDTQAAVQEGLGQAERGEGSSAQEVVSGLRAKYGISRGSSHKRTHG